MPTFDFIRETAEDRWHERDGGAAAVRIPIACPVCTSELDDEFALAIHLGEAHPLTAPRLLIGDEVVVGERVVHRRGDAQRLSVANATQLLVACDGEVARPWSPPALRDFVAESSRALLDLTLRNERAADAASATEHVRLHLDIADDADLDAVDAAFAVLSDGLDEHAANAFVDAVGPYASAARYASALHDYAVGVLVKDGATVLEFDQFHAKYNRALDVLRHYPERPVARAAAGFARFNLNDFRDGSGVPVLDRCSRQLARLGDSKPVPETAADVVFAGRCPADSATAAILDGWERRDGRALLDQADAGRTTAADAAKCRALALTLAGPSDKRLIAAARRLTGDLSFGPWATAIVEDART